MGYWKSKVEPLFKKVFDKNSPKKLAAAEASKAFEESKEGYAKEVEEKKSELQTKVIEIYEASSTAIKGLVKEPKEASVKKNSASVQKFLVELDKIDFPGVKTVCEASSKFGPGLIPGPVIFIFEQVSSFVITQDPPAAAVDDAAAAAPAEGEGEKVEEIKAKEIAVEPEKKEEEPPTTATATAEVVEPVKVEPPPTVEETTPAKP